MASNLGWAQTGRRIVRLMGEDVPPRKHQPPVKPQSSDRIVAIAKAAYACGVAPGVIAQHMKVSRKTITCWALNKRRVDVLPDPTFKRRFEALWK